MLDHFEKPATLAPRGGRFQFSLRHSLYAMTLIAFALASWQKDEFSLASLLSSLCVGVLVFGLGLQVADLWKSRELWKLAEAPEQNGWRLSIAVRVAILLGLVYVWAKSGGDLFLREWLPASLSEFTSYMSVYEQVLPPLMLVLALSLAPWNWRASAVSNKFPTLRRLAKAALLAAIATIAWHEHSLLPALVHIAIAGVVLTEPLSINLTTPLAALPSPEAIQQGAAIACLAISLSLAEALALAKAWTTKDRLSWTGWIAITAVLLAACGYLLYVLHHVHIPVNSPFILTESAYADPVRVIAIVIACLVTGSGLAYWRQLRFPSLISSKPISPSQNSLRPVLPTPIWRKWRRKDYPHETRFFLELLVFSQILNQLPFWTSLTKSGYEALTIQLSEEDIRSAWWTLANLCHGGVIFAPLLLAFDGLFRQDRQALSSTEESPTSISLQTFLLEAPLWGLVAYLIAESVIWSGFFYHITSGNRFANYS